MSSWNTFKPLGVPPPAAEVPLEESERAPTPEPELSIFQALVTAFSKKDGMAQNSDSPVADEQNIATGDESAREDVGAPLLDKAAPVSTSAAAADSRQAAPPAVIQLVLPTRVTAPEPSFKPEDVERLKEFAHVVRGQARAEVSEKRRLLLRLRDVAALHEDPEAVNNKLISPGISPPDRGAGAMPFFPSQTKALRTSQPATAAAVDAAAVMADSADDMAFLDRLLDVEVTAGNAVSPDVLASLKCLSTTTALLQLAQQEDRALESVIDQIAAAAGAHNDRSAEVEQLKQREEVVRGLEAMAATRLKDVNDKWEAAKNDITSKLGQLAMEQANLKLQQAALASTAPSRPGSAQNTSGVPEGQYMDPSVEDNGDDMYLLGRKALGMSRLRAEALAAQPWTLGLTLRRWHQPNGSSSTRKSHVSQWLMAMQDWCREVKLIQNFGTSVPAFHGVEQVRSALICSIEGLITDVRLLGPKPKAKASINATDMGFVSSSACLDAVRSACNRGPYVLFALERRVRLQLLRIQAYTALQEVCDEGQAARDRIVDAHLQAGTSPITPLEEGGMSGISTGIGVEPAPENNVVALADEAALKRSIGAFPFLVAAIRELFPVDIVPDEKARMGQVSEVETQLRNSIRADVSARGEMSSRDMWSPNKSQKFRQRNPRINSAVGFGSGVAAEPEISEVVKDALLASDRLRCHGRIDIDTSTSGGKKSDSANVEFVAHRIVVGLDLRVRALLASWSLEHLRPYIVYTCLRVQGCIIDMDGQAPHGNARMVGDVVILLRATQAGLAKSAVECGYRVQMVNDPLSESIKQVAVAGHRTVAAESQAALFQDVRTETATAAAARCQLLLNRSSPINYGQAKGVGMELRKLNDGDVGGFCLGSNSADRSASSGPRWNELFIAPYAPYSASADASALWRRRGLYSSEADVPAAAVSNRTDINVHELVEQVAASASGSYEDAVVTQEQTIRKVAGDTVFFPKDVVRLTYRLLMTAPWVDGVAPSRDFQSVRTVNANSAIPSAVTTPIQLQELAEAHKGPTHALVQGQYMDLARCVLGPDCYILHDHEALQALNRTYETKAKPVALRDAIGVSSTDPALVQGVRQYFGEAAATLLTLMMRMRRDMTIMLIIMLVIRFAVLEVTRLASGRDANEETYRLLQYVYTIATIALLTPMWEQAWKRKKALHEISWGIRHPSPEKAASNQAAAIAAAENIASGKQGSTQPHAKVKQSAGASMTGSYDEAPEDDHMIIAGRFFKPWYSGGQKFLHYFYLGLIFLLQAGCFVGVAYFAWWTQDQQFDADQPPGILTPVILSSLSAVTVALGEALLALIRSCDRYSKIRKVGTGNIRSRACVPSLPAGKGVDDCRKVYTTNDERHDFALAFLIRFLPHYTTVIYLALIDYPATGGRLCYKKDPFLAAAYQVIGLNIAQFLVDLVWRLWCCQCRYRSRARIGARICSACAPVLPDSNSARIPWFLWFQRWAINVGTKEAPVGPCVLIQEKTEAPMKKGEPYTGVDGRGPWGTPPLSGTAGTLRISCTLKRLATGLYDPALHVPRVAPGHILRGLPTFSSAFGKPGEAVRRACGVLGLSEAGLMELTAEKFVEARAATAYAVHSRAAILQIYKSWVSVSSPPIGSPDDCVLLIDSSSKGQAGAEKTKVQLEPKGKLRGGGAGTKKAISFASDELKAGPPHPLGVEDGLSDIVPARRASLTLPSTSMQSDDSTMFSDFAYLLPHRDQPSVQSVEVFTSSFAETGDAAFKRYKALVDVNAFQPAVFKETTLCELPHHFEADHYAQLLFIFSNAVIALILQPWYALIATPICFHLLDNYVDMLVSHSTRRYPSRLLTDFWTSPMRLMVAAGALVALLVMARNPLTSLTSIPWPLESLNGAEFALGVIGVTALWLIVREAIGACLAGNLLGNGCCCGRRPREYAAIRAYLGYVEQELFEKANRIHLDLIRAHALAGGQMLINDQARVAQYVLEGQLRDVICDPKAKQAGADMKDTGDTGATVGAKVDKGKRKPRSTKEPPIVVEVVSMAATPKK